MKYLIILFMICSLKATAQKEVFYNLKWYNGESFFVFTPNIETTTIQRHTAFKSWLIDTIICERVRYWNGEKVVEAEIPYLYRIGSTVYYDVYKEKWRWFRKGILKKPLMIDIREIYYRDLGWQKYH